MDAAEEGGEGEEEAWKPLLAGAVQDIDRDGGEDSDGDRDKKRQAEAEERRRLREEQRGGGVRRWVAQVADVALRVATRCAIGRCRDGSRMHSGSVHQHRDGHNPTATMTSRGWMDGGRHTRHSASTSGASRCRVRAAGAGAG